MIVSWIVITLIIAVVAACLAGGTAQRGEGAFSAFFAAFWVVDISLFIAMIYVASHFISKYW